MQITLQVKGSEIQSSLRNKRESEAGNAKPRVGLCIARLHIGRIQSFKGGAGATMNRLIRLSISS